MKLAHRFYLFLLFCALSSSAILQCFEESKEEMVTLTTGKHVPIFFKQYVDKYILPRMEWNRRTGLQGRIYPIYSHNSRAYSYITKLNDVYKNQEKDMIENIGDSNILSKRLRNCQSSSCHTKSKNMQDDDFFYSCDVLEALCGGDLLSCTEMTRVHYPFKD